MGRIADRTDPGGGPEGAPRGKEEAETMDEAFAPWRHAAPEAPGPATAGLSWMPAVTVHGLQEAEAVLRVAAEGCGEGRGAVLLSAPGAAIWPGPAGFVAVIRLARARHPTLPCRALLDCGTMPGLALRALREGWRELILAETCPAFAQVSGAARMAGAVLHGRAPRALSLDGIDLRRPGGMAILRRWLTVSPTGGEMTGEAGRG
ncbi:MAG: hypothetical protein DI532_01290 [Azospirillum brasilense]|nr:MAG: hypothetical protein DI532_01290 [Azospirillum brasilense]